MKWLAIILLLSVPLANAQTVGDCETGRAEADLDVGDVLARVFNTGNLFHGNETRGGYLVPADEGVFPLYSVGLWIGGLVNDEIRVAGARYAAFEYWPGPLDDLGNPPSDCSEFDRIYSVGRSDIERFIETGEASADLRDWPVDLGAPVLDGDGIEGNYEPEGGDQPAIMGDQMLWWVMNDRGNHHETSKTTPMGLEVAVSAFGVHEGPESRRLSTIYRYQITNKSTETIDSAYVSLFVDTSLGDASDNWVGVDTLHSIGYVYNASNYDSESAFGYGLNPPAVGIATIDTPVGLPNLRDDDRDGVVDEPGEQSGLSSFRYYVSGFSFPASIPNIGSTMYPNMKGLFSDGTAMREGGSGFDSDGRVTNYAFSGDPVTETYWSMINADGNGNPIFGGGGDMWMLVSTGPFRLIPGQSDEFVFAIVYGRGSDYLGSIDVMRGAAENVRVAYSEGVYDPQYIESEVEYQPEGAESILLSRAYPNPFVDQTTIRYALPAAMDIRLAVFDVLGREVALLAEGEQPQGEHEATLSGEALRPGAYFVRLEAGNASKTISLLRR